MIIPKQLWTALAILPLFLVSSCANKLTSSKKHPDPAHHAFVSKADYKKTYAVYKNNALLDNKSLKASKIVVDKKNQRTLVYIGSKVAIDTPCTTGKSGKVTPSGNFKVTSKIKDKRSNIFGRYYKNGKLVYGGDRRKYKKSYDKYVGSSLPYWMRLTSDGIGFHGSNGIKRYPASNGCIRLPHSVASKIYYKVNKNTPVVVTY